MEFEKLDSVNNVESDLSGGNPEITVNVDPEKAAKAGLSPSVVSGSLASLLGESTLTTLRDAPVIVGVPDRVRRLARGGQGAAGRERDHRRGRGRGREGGIAGGHQPHGRRADRHGDR